MYIYTYTCVRFLALESAFHAHIYVSKRALKCLIKHALALAHTHTCTYTHSQTHFFISFHLRNQTTIKNALFTDPLNIYSLVIVV